MVDHVSRTWVKRSKMAVSPSSGEVQDQDAPKDEVARTITIASAEDYVGTFLSANPISRIVSSDLKLTSIVRSHSGHSVSRTHPQLLQTSSSEFHLVVKLAESVLCSLYGGISSCRGFDEGDDGCDLA